MYGLDIAASPADVLYRDYLNTVSCGRAVGQIGFVLSEQNHCLGCILGRKREITVFRGAAGDLQVDAAVLNAVPGDEFAVDLKQIIRGDLILHSKF